MILDFGPSLVSLMGIRLDTQCMQAHLPNDKLQCLHHQVAAWLSQKKATKRQTLSLVGLLQHATKVVTPERTFYPKCTMLQRVLNAYHTTLALLWPSAQT